MLDVTGFILVRFFNLTIVDSPPVVSVGHVLRVWQELAVSDQTEHRLDLINLSGELPSNSLIKKVNKLRSCLIMCEQYAEHLLVLVGLTNHIYKRWKSGMLFSNLRIG